MFGVSLSKTQPSESWFQRSPAIALALRPDAQESDLESRHQFFSQSQKFIVAKLNNFLEGQAGSYYIKANTREGKILLVFDHETVPRTQDLRRFIDHLNVILYLSNPENSHDAFSVSKIARNAFDISYNHFAGGYSPETLRKSASDLARIIADDKESRNSF